MGPGGAGPVPVQSLPTVGGHVQRPAGPSPQVASSLARCCAATLQSTTKLATAGDAAVSSPRFDCWRLPSRLTARLLPTARASPALFPCLPHPRPQSTPSVPAGNVRDAARPAAQFENAQPTPHETATSAPIGPASLASRHGPCRGQPGLWHERRLCRRLRLGLCRWLCRRRARGSRGNRRRCPVHQAEGSHRLSKVSLDGCYQVRLDGC